jgi:hypothetical protein
MLPKSFKTLLLVCSIALPLYGCKQGPKLTICIADGENDVLQCRKPNGEVFALTMVGANNYVCMSPSDTEALLNYCKRK